MDRYLNKIITTYQNDIWTPDGRLLEYDMLDMLIIAYDAQRDVYHGELMTGDHNDGIIVYLAKSMLDHLNWIEDDD